ncbi:hypothetical protein PINS_up021252 [Pythium insidiosum]|nr:hypothetical protein PINS_up021252 [Pythium insidiosum]
MSSAVTLPIKFLADDAPTVVATVGSTERTLQLDIVCSNVLVRCVDDAKCPEHCAGDVEIINYSSYHKLDNTCMLPVNTTVSTKGFTTSKNFRVGQVGVIADDQSWRIPTRADGVFGLGPTSRSSYSDNLRLSGSTDDSMLSAQVSSFSLSFGTTTADGGSVILNGADDERIAKEKLTGYTVQLKRGNGYDLSYRNVLWDGVEMQQPFDTEPFQLDTVVDMVELPSRAWGSIWGKLSGVSCKLNYQNSKTEYTCDATAKLPPLGLTFGDSTFYLTKEQYTAPHPKQADRVLLKLASTYKTYRLGLPFLRAFPVQITPGSSVTIYCREGKSCVKGVTPKQTPTSRPPRSDILDGGVKRPVVDDSSDDTSFATKMHNIGLVHAIVSAVVLVLLIVVAIVRKQRNTKNAVARESIDAVPVVELTPGATSAEFVDAKTPKA